MTRQTDLIPIVGGGLALAPRRQVSAEGLFDGAPEFSAIGYGIRFGRDGFPFATKADGEGERGCGTSTSRMPWSG